jgi:hypothetical protein
LEIVKYLVEECNTDPTAQDNSDVVYVSQFGHLDIVKYLVEECKADPTAQDSKAIVYASQNETGKKNGWKKTQKNNKVKHHLTVGVR